MMHHKKTNERENKDAISTDPYYEDSNLANYERVGSARTALDGIELKEQPREVLYEGRPTVLESQQDFQRLTHLAQIKFNELIAQLIEKIRAFLARQQYDFLLY